MAQWIEHRIPVPRVGGSSPFWRTKNGSSHSGWPVFDVSGGTRTIKYRCPVDICSAAAGRRRLLSVTSPFWRTGNESPYRDGPFLMCQAGLEPSNTDVRWTSARRRLDDADTIMYRVPSGVPKTGHPIRDGPFLMCQAGLEPFHADVRWTSARRRIGRYTVRPSRRERPVCRSAQPRYLHGTMKGIPSVQTASHSTGYSGPLGYGRCADGTAHRPFPTDSSNIIPFILPPKYNFSPWWIHPKGTGHIQSNIQIQQGKFSAAQGIFLRKRVEFPGCV